MSYGISSTGFLHKSGFKILWLFQVSRSKVWKNPRSTFLKNSIKIHFNSFYYNENDKILNCKFFNNICEKVKNNFLIIITLFLLLFQIEHLKNDDPLGKHLLEYWGLTLARGALQGRSEYFPSYSWDYDGDFWFK